MKIKVALTFSFIFMNLIQKHSFVDLEALFSEMSAEDKCGQMTQVSFETFELNPHSYDAIVDADEDKIDETKLVEAIGVHRVGSMLTMPSYQPVKASTAQKIIKKIQDYAMKKTRLKIPVLYAIDSVHGASFIREGVLFPQPLSIAATFNTDIAQKIGKIAAMETRATGIAWNFHPVLDVGRQPQWPRLYETFGEDTHLVSKMGEAFVKGHQGSDLRNRESAATCLKHFIGYSVPLNGRDRTPAYIPENLLREVFLPPFEAAVRAGAATVMINSAEVNGVPGHVNGYYINQILKKELNFKGLVVSNWHDVINLYVRDKVAESLEDAVRLAVLAGTKN
jgi:beta-glucosidase